MNALLKTPVRPSPRKFTPKNLFNGKSSNANDTKRLTSQFPVYQPYVYVCPPNPFGQNFQNIASQPPPMIHPQIYQQQQHQQMHQSQQWQQTQQNRRYQNQAPINQ